MGVWGPQSFANDEALDWLCDLIDEDDPFFVHNTLDIIVDYPGDEPPEAWDCSCALAAAELVAAANGKPPEEFPQAANVWLERHTIEIDPQLLTSASRAVERVKSNSELQQLWDESPEKEDWYKCLADLIGRLK